MYFSGSSSSMKCGGVCLLYGTGGAFGSMSHGSSRMTPAQSGRTARSGSL